MSTWNLTGFWNTAGPPVALYSARKLVWEMTLWLRLGICGVVGQHECAGHRPAPHGPPPHPPRAGQEPVPLCLCAGWGRGSRVEEERVGGDRNKETPWSSCWDQRDSLQRLGPHGHCRGQHPAALWAREGRRSQCGQRGPYALDIRAAKGNALETKSGGSLALEESLLGQGSAAQERPEGPAHAGRLTRGGILQRWREREREARSRGPKEEGRLPWQVVPRPWGTWAEAAPG